MDKMIQSPDHHDCSGAGQVQVIRGEPTECRSAGAEDN